MKALLGGVMTGGDFTNQQAIRLNADRENLSGRQDERINLLEQRLENRMRELENRVERMLMLLEDLYSGRTS